MPKALMTGSGGRAPDVVAFLRRGAFKPLCTERATELVDVCARATSVAKASAEFAEQPDLGSAEWHLELLSLLETR